MELGWSTLCTHTRLLTKLAWHNKLGQLLLDPAQAAVEVEGCCTVAAVWWRSAQLTGTALP